MRSKVEKRRRLAGTTLLKTRKKWNCISCLRQGTLKMIPWLAERPYIGNIWEYPPPPPPGASPRKWSTGTHARGEPSRAKETAVYSTLRTREESTISCIRPCSHLVPEHGYRWALMWTCRFFKDPTPELGHGLCARSRPCSRALQWVWHPVYEHNTVLCRCPGTSARAPNVNMALVSKRFVLLRPGTLDVTLTHLRLWGAVINVTRMLCIRPTSKIMRALLQEGSEIKVVDAPLICVRVGRIIDERMEFSSETSKSLLIKPTECTRKLCATTKYV